jgi:hypothetical protein
MTSEHKVQERLASLEDRVEKLEGALHATVSEAPVTKMKKFSAKEFLLTKNIKTDTQRVLALGYFLEYTNGMESFNVNDLETAFRAAKEKLPSNMNDVVNKNIARGLLMEAAAKKDTKKAWCLTSTGEQYLQSKLNK